MPRKKGADPPNPAGEQLRRLREELRLTMREVSQASVSLAKK